MATEWEAENLAMEEEISAALALAKQEAVRAQADAALKVAQAASLSAAHAAASARAEKLQGTYTPEAPWEAREAFRLAEAAVANLALARPCNVVAFAANPPPHFREDFKGSFVSRYWGMLLHPAIFALPRLPPPPLTPATTSPLPTLLFPCRGDL
jgi:hypothetical protein